VNKRKQIILLIALIFLFLVINYNSADNWLKKFVKDSDIRIVERIIDGDTIVVENNTHIRLLGINTPEKNEFYHDEAMNFLIEMISNKTVTLEYGKEKTDLYGRTLAYVILDGKNVNVEQVRNGFANTYVYDNDEYTSSLNEAWKECIASGKNLCEKSNDKCAECIELKNLDVKKQKIIFYNNCSFDCDLTKWNIKDERRKNFFFGNFILKSNNNVNVIVGNYSNDENNLFWKGYDYVWTSTGDTLFLRDENGKLVLWQWINRG
jgi:micrococcal nuclease